jgi:hypothetical protein
MRATTEGITLTRAEIAALLEFTGDDAGSPTSRVQVHTRGEAVGAYATDGRRAVEVTGTCEDGVEDGDWQIESAFLDAVRKVLDSKGDAVLHVRPNGVQEATLRGEDGAPVGTVVWPHDAATTQIPLDALRASLRIPGGSRSVRCITVPSSQLAALEKVGKAAGRDGVTLYPPATIVEPLVFQCESETGDWIGAIMPMRGDEDDDGEARGKAARKQARKSEELFPAVLS